jgi:LacI family transcriptional regulator
MSDIGGRRATLDSVALDVGVSKATVSKVLNGRPGVSEGTRRRVVEAVDRLGYAPTTQPRPATVRRRIAVHFDTLANLYSLRMLDGLIAAGQGLGVDIVPDVMAPLDPGPGPALDRQRIVDLRERGHAGLLVVTTQLTPGALELSRDPAFPVLAVDPQDALDPAIASIGSNNWSGGLQATEHLVSLGHRRIGFVGGWPSHAGLIERRGGYRAALEGAGLIEDPALVSERGLGLSGVDAVGMLGLDDPPTAFFASTDPGALTVIREVTRAGRRVPDDISVVGYDDTYAELPALVGLTTVHTPITEIGRAALGTLVGMIDGVAPLSSHLQLATSLVIRESTAPPPGLVM